MLNSKLKSILSIAKSQAAFETISDRDAYSIMGGEDSANPRTKEEEATLRNYFGLKADGSEGDEKAR